MSYILYEAGCEVVKNNRTSQPVYHVIVPADTAPESKARSLLTRYLAGHYNAKLADVEFARMASGSRAELDEFIEEYPGHIDPIESQ